MIYTEDRIMAEAATAPAFGLDRLWNEVSDLGVQRYIEDLDAPRTQGPGQAPPWQGYRARHAGEQRR